MRAHKRSPSFSRFHLLCPVMVEACNPFVGSECETVFINSSALSQVGTDPDITLGVARMWNNNKQTNLVSHRIDPPSNRST